MKKQVLFDIKKMSSKIAAVAVFSLLTVQSSIAQTWPVIGGGDQISNSGTSYTSIAVLNDVPYVVSNESDTASSSSAGGVARVKRRKSDGTWEKVGNDIGTISPAALVTYTRIFLDKANNLYVSYIDVASGNKLAVKKYNSGTDTWDTVGGEGTFVSDASATNAVSNFSNSFRSSMAFDSSNTPYIAYIDGTTSYPVVKKLVGTTWTNVSNNPILNPAAVVAPAAAWAHSVSLVIDGAGVPWLAFCNMSSAAGTGGNNILLYQFNGTDWVSTTTLSGLTSCRLTNMAVNSAGNLTIAYADTSTTGGTKASIIVYDKTLDTWGSKTALASNVSQNISIISDASANLYCAFIENTTNLSPRVFKQAAGASNWSEFKEPLRGTTIGLDNLTGGLNIAIGSKNPFIVYTKKQGSPAAAYNSAAVRAFDPLVTTAAVTGITDTAAKFSGEVLVTAATAGTITERGIVYATTNNPTTVNTIIKDAAVTVGVFTGSTATETPLTASTTYYERAYFIYTTDGGTTLYTVYGENKMFTTAAAGTLGTDSFEKTAVVNAYPNPTTDSVTVSLPNGAAVQKIAVYNNLGQLVLTEANNTVSLKNLNKGIYFLNIYTAEGNFSKKIIKQ